MSSENTDDSCRAAFNILRAIPRQHILERLAKAHQEVAILSAFLDATSVPMPRFNQPTEPDDPPAAQEPKP